VTGLALGAYRAATSIAGATAAPVLRLFVPRRSAWHDALTGGDADVARVAGTVWVHASSMGEVVAARNWIQALLKSGQRPPLLLTTRTQRGLDRARRELGERVVARIAPLDLPQLLRSFLCAAAPRRVDIVETEVWPQLILQSRKRSAGVVFVSAAVSERTRRRLLGCGIAGSRLLGEGVWVLAQSERQGDRFCSLGVPKERVAVIGDLKAEAPLATAADDPAGRPAVVLGSLRPGEEDVAAHVARVLRAKGDGRALIVVPRHREGFARSLARLRSAGFAPVIRDEEGRAREGWSDWLGSLVTSPAPRVGLLATQGELPAAYGASGIAIVGGTFAPYGGHNVLEPAARGCAIIVGPYHEAVEEGVAALGREGAIVLAEDSASAAEAVGRLLDSPDALRRMGEGAARAAGEAALAPRRAVEALERFGLIP